MKWNPGLQRFSLGRKGDKMPLPSYAYAAAHIFAWRTSFLGRDRVEQHGGSPFGFRSLKGIIWQTEYAAGISELDGSS
jgi:hypothetical protein